MKEDALPSPTRQTATQSLVTLPRTAKRLLVVALDVCLCMITAWLSICLRFEAWVSLDDYQWLAVVASPVLAVPLLAAFGLYSSVFRFAGRESLRALVGAIAIYAALYATLFTVIGFPLVPRTIGLLQPALLLLCVGATRFLAGELLSETPAPARSPAARVPVFIYGAGDTGRQLAESLARTSMRVVGFLDDNPSLQGGRIMGQLVYNPAAIEAQVQIHGVRDVLLALPSVSRARRTEIVKLLNRARVGVRTLPRLADLAHRRVDADQLREVSLEDLLGRDPVPPDAQLMARNITGKTVMVTGAGGSIGSELCRQIVAQHPAQLVLVELNEYALYAVVEDLEGLRQAADDKPTTLQLTPLLADVRDENRMTELMQTHRPDTVYHAAAYKHVPLVEDNPVAAIRNNVLGTLNVARAALRAGVQDVVLISTDKAVRPTNVMGATKRLAEMVVQALAREGLSTGAPTRFSMVRFGNVLGSSGSVIPKFRQQIQNGGPVTVTHPDITRYFMTIPEAAQLVIQAAAMSADSAEPGPVYLLDMGDPVRIQDLARLMVHLSGFTVRDADNPEGDIVLAFTGLRPGEKLFEELLISSDAQPTRHPKVCRAHEAWLNWNDLEPVLNELRQLSDTTPGAEVRRVLRRHVPDYHPTTPTAFPA